MTPSDLADESGTDRTKTITVVWTDLWGKAKALIVTAVILSLVALNILTLVDDVIHSMAYRALESLTERAVFQEVARRVLGRPPLANSPSNARKKDVRIATEKLNSEKALLDKANMALITKNDTLTKAHKDLDEKHTALRKATNDLETKHAVLHKSNKDLETRHEQLQRSVQNNKVAATKVSKRIASRSVKGAVRNITAMAAEAVPVLGTTVIVAVTAWDVHDACENLKDLNEVSTVLETETEDDTKVCGLRVPTKDEVMDQVKSNWEGAYKAAEEWMTLPSQ